MRVASLFAVVAGIGLLCGCKRGTESARSDSSTYPRRVEQLAPPIDSRTPEDLATYLARAGINVNVRSRPLLNRSGRTAMAMSDDLPERPATVFVYHCPNEADAREQAASMGTGAFASGRFALGTRGEATARDRELLAQIAGALIPPVGQSTIRVAE